MFRLPPKVASTTTRPTSTFGSGFTGTGWPSPWSSTSMASGPSAWPSSGRARGGRRPRSRRHRDGDRGHEPAVRTNSSGATRSGRQGGADAGCGPGGGSPRRRAGRRDGPPQPSAGPSGVPARQLQWEVVASYPPRSERLPPGARVARRRILREHRAPRTVNAPPRGVAERPGGPPGGPPAGRVRRGTRRVGSVCGRHSPAQLRGQTALPARPGAGQRGRARRRAMRPAKPTPRMTSAEGAGTAATSRWMARASRLFAEAPTSVTPAVAVLIVTRWLSPFRSMLTPKRTPALLKSAAPMTMEAPSTRGAPESAATRVWLPSAALVQPPLPAQAGRRYGCPGPRYGSSSGRRAGRGDGERGKWAEKRAQHL